MKYVRLCKTTNTKGDIIPFTSQADIEKLTQQSPNSDWYTSLFHYGQEAVDYFKSHGSIAGFDGPATLSELVFDLDSKGDVELARQDTMKLLKKLKDLGVDNRKSTRIYFSGNKGFHVYVSLPKEYTNKELEYMCSGIAEDIATFDTVIYNTSRLFRVVNTKHNSSGLYKILLTVDELFGSNMDLIRLAAMYPNPKEVVTTPVEDVSAIEAFNKPPQRTFKPVVIDANDDVRGIREIDFSKCPKTTPRCVYALTHGIVQSGNGERSAVFLRLAAYYKNQGMSKEATYGALKGVARDNARLYPEHEPYTAGELWNNIISSAFKENGHWQTRPGTTGIDAENPIFKKYCDVLSKHTSTPCCLHHRSSSKTESTITVNGIESSFDDFATNFDKNIVKTGIRLIDDYMKIATGTTTLIAGACGSGKTTLCLNIMENANTMQQHTMFFSLDMHKNLVYLKLAQKLTSYSQDQILGFYKDKDRAKVDEIRKVINEKYGKTYFDFSATLSIEDMRDKVMQMEEKNNCKIKLVVVDYASRVSSQYADPYANARYNALKSTEVAGETNAAWIWLNQVSRNAGNGATPLRTKRVAKDSGDWEESATNLITCWRPFMGKENEDNVIRLFLAKNRMGKEIERPLHWDGAKGLVVDMTSQEYMDYKEEREPLEAQKSDKGGWS